MSQKLNFNERLYTDISVSLNANSYEWERLYPGTSSGKVHFRKQWLPNIGLTYVFGKGLSVRAKIGKGNSAPTNEEIRSSNQEFNLDLVPEYGWNKEIGIRKQFGNFFISGRKLFRFSDDGCYCKETE
ncbi:TonB-dependent receptor domain-containing protein [Chryseobacterium proteolyticum]|uniref:TonB-dependent receptor domain-containing protein n=1 Tax=Chryseobacterium proteolyticum TaxID=118127 RepID=UPI0039836742